MIKKLQTFWPHKLKRLSRDCFLYRSGKRHGFKNWIKVLTTEGEYSHGTNK